MSLFSVNSVSLITNSYLNIHNDLCPICRCNIENKCSECIELSDSTIECKSVLGTCNHAYHLHCIQTWLKTKYICPLDNKLWNYMKHKCNHNHDS